MAKEKDMRDLFKVGDLIGGFCNGYFGRDDYYDKKCVMVMPKYAVFENEYGHPSILNFTHNLLTLIPDNDNWLHTSQQTDDEDY